jgi:dienelactone hydrolase/uncharacterized protein YciI
VAYFVLIRERASAWDWTKPMRQQAEWDAHAAFMDALESEGFIVAGGPLGSEDEAARVMHVCNSHDAETVEARMLEDPWTPMGMLLTVSIEPWTVLLGGLSRRDGGVRCFDVIAVIAAVAALSPAAMQDRLRAVAAEYYAAVAKVERVTSRDTVIEYHQRLLDDADAWTDPKYTYLRSQEGRDAFAAACELDMSLATQLMQRSYRPMASIRGLGETLVRSSSDGTMQPVAVYVPTQYSPDRPARLIIFLHGRDGAESHLLAVTPIPQEAERTNTIVVAPFGRGYYDFKGSESDVYDALAAANSAFAIAPHEQYLAGYSMGGFSTFAIGPLHPTDWAAVLCVSGSLVEQRAEATTRTMHNIRFYLVTGALDPIVPTSWSTLTAGYLRAANMEVSLYSEPRGTHELRTLLPAFSQAWDDMERGVVRLPWDLPVDGRLPVASP